MTDEHGGQNPSGGYQRRAVSDGRRRRREERSSAVLETELAENSLERRVEGHPELLVSKEAEEILWKRDTDEPDKTPLWKIVALCAAGSVVCFGGCISGVSWISSLAGSRTAAGNCGCRHGRRGIGIFSVEKEAHKSKFLRRSSNGGSQNRKKQGGKRGGRKYEFQKREYENGELRTNSSVVSRFCLR